MRKKAALMSGFRLPVVSRWT